MSKFIQVSYTPSMDYAQAWEKQKEIVRGIDAGEQEEHLLLLQHPPTYTIGSQRHPEHLLWNEQELAERGITLFQIDRGGDITYHGPGQLVGYPILLLDAAKGIDPHRYLRTLEQVIIDYLAEQGIEAGRKEEYTGVWIGDLKIAAIGIKFNKCRHRKGFITSHGFAFNISSGIQNEGFSGIVPCGIEQYGVTSLEDITGRTFTVEQVAQEILPHFMRHFEYAQPDEPLSL
ncbi:lipoyl(octanoyl) transferase LipB [Paenibacillus sp. PsM32]|uniref:Octanoyltransferase n=1 Tax=Paenibacillus kyungheensis TaxID=1452732 RepID=A0AAX3LX85_9BACL|nr:MULTISPECIES: lipoyl(octanoyl) transferase LipB [Paenibacillus]MDN4619682.1 lipoyl(octanoyl) transferase LipB [Paenibacillus sp. PsM32]MDQ1234799.1 lipoyl(octanoyl) transferase [Paenibacillus sp. SORGH_AS_0306]MDR6111846.1 lipoyl(octanoyl) transferase [Paenibacillus sp. SORGH_AS_0338]WCT54385.1 lipoyl(octanoyl) transferase LipB [Paenibacillus kyungheensis]WDF52488.1 lipoyl(octanoyl) transferase LipB [Paenibacillus sp. KACC 21273]